MNCGLRFGCILLAVVTLVILGIMGGILLDRQVLTRFIPLDNVPADAQDSFRLIAQAWNVIDAEYVDQEAADPETLTYGAIAGMVNGLGDTGHSTFLTPEMMQESTEVTTGQFEGVGVYVEMRDDRPVIVAPIGGSPAEAAGLQPGDVILGVDGENITDMPLTQIVERITGPAGSRVTLTILRADSGEMFEVTLTREKIDIESVFWTPVPGTGVAHLRIVIFSAGVTEDLAQALTEIRQQGMDGIILDLRRNPGGLLAEAIGVTSQFLDSGNVLLSKNAHGKVTEEPVKEGGLWTDLPLVVLIDAGSASASEIVSGALQDQDRARLIGETTFGTGTVLRPFLLADGSALMLATELWLTPNGRVIWHQGIEPDIAVELPADTTPQVPAIDRPMTAEQLESTDDAQFLKALETLLGDS